MKKLFVKLMAVAIAACTFTACEDVPEPYNNPYDSMKEQVSLVEVEPAGTGTAADPYNVTALIAACEGLGAGEYINNGNEVYVKGIVVETTEVSAQYGNATYYIADDLNGLLRFYVFRGKLLDGASVTSDNDLKVGDKVTVCGKVFNYQDKSGNLTLEFAQGNYLVALNSASGNGGGNTEAKTIGTAEAPITVAQALELINGYADGGSSETDAYVKGTISRIQSFNEQYKSITYYISDDGSSNNELQCYSGKNIGGADFASQNDLQVGTVVVVKGKLKKYVNKSGVVTAEIDQSNEIVSVGDQGSTTPTGEAKGTGTLNDPFNAVAATNEAKKLSSGASSDKAYYIKSKVASIAVDKSGNAQNFDFNTYGNASFYISEDGTDNNTFYCYRILYLGNKKWEQGAGDVLKVGDEVIVYAKLTMYNTTPETLQNEGYLYSLNGKTADGGDTPTPSGENTKENPYSVAKALEIARALSSSDKVENVYVKGVVVELESYNGQYGNSRYYIADAASSTDRLYIYDGKGLDNTNFNALEDLKIGDEVIVFGTLSNYQGTTPEMNRGNYLVSLNGSNAGGNDNPTTGNGFGTLNGNVLTLVAADCGFENASELSTVTLTDGTKLVFAQGDGTNGPKYYTAGASFRLYAKNSVSIQAGTKTIQKVVVTLPSADKKGNEQMTPKPSIDGTTATFNNVNKSTLDIVNDYTDVKAGTQFHIAAIEITYAN